MKIIDATKAIESIDEIVCSMSVCINSDYCHGMRAMKDMALHTLEEQPTVDAVPVTRCMDCKHSTKVEGMIGLVWCDQLAEVGTWVENDWFCADGERKDGEHEQ